MSMGRLIGCGVVAATLLPLGVALFVIVGLLAFVESLPSADLATAATDLILGRENQATGAKQQLGTRQRGGGPRGLAAYESDIASASERYAVDPRLVRAVILQESGGNPEATSPVGAAGLMQLMPATFAGMGYDPARIYEPGQNIDAGTRYLASGLASFDGDVYWAAAAYNAGGGQARWLKETYGYVPATFAGGETFRFVRAVLGLTEGG